MRVLLTCAALCLLLPGVAAAQSIAIDLGEGGSVSATSIQLILAITLLSLAPGIAIMVTCFPFMVTVLAILRQAVGLQQSPPNMLIVSLALFLTYFVMAPVFQEAYTLGIAPLLDGTLEPQAALAAAYGPFRGFMLNRVEVETLQSLAELRGLSDIAD